ncbi:unnamed protein product [Darwinula stevensoni]|uniref:CUB domain-containing protein n=1 Tax=Darwinula stevensoni TaxID=69355 RepID=A0A7R9FT59_9CRUS|nr:unnamed protein product [Darwinula stevensoni]CAG0903987.1 unnamed protein product [Darwinula stevensoni]
MCFLREPALLLLLLVYLCDGKSVLKADDEDHRDSKYSILNLFTRFTSANTNCTGDNGDEGICYTAKECRRMGGTISSKPCAQGFGVCCIFFKTCQGSTSEEVAYFQNTKYPEPETTRNKACMFQLTVPHKDFCQVRLDFDNFELAEPNMPDGTKAAKCRDDDSFVIEGGHEINPLNMDHVELCGNNTGQHLYVHLNKSAVPITFTLFVQADTTPYKWKIKTTMIDCTKESRLKAPSQCLQYYIGSEGTIQSFNYGSGSSNYLRNLDYQICINREFDKCGILYTATKFSLDSTNPDNNNLPPFYCGNADRLTVLGASPGVRCGNGNATSFPNLLVCYSGQFILNFKSNDEDNGDGHGFQIKYHQQPMCDPSCK